MFSCILVNIKFSTFVVEMQECRFCFNIGGGTDIKGGSFCGCKHNFRFFKKKRAVQLSNCVLFAVLLCTLMSMSTKYWLS